jgi:hypothetical protein
MCESEQQATCVSLLTFILRHVCKIAKSDYWLYHVHLSVHTHGTTRLPLDRFWWNLIFELFLQICQQNSSFIKIQQLQHVLYVKMLSHLWQYLNDFFLEWETFKIQVVEKIHIIYSVTFSENWCCLWENVKKYGGAREAADGNMVAHYILHKQGYTYARTRQHARAHTHTHTHREISKIYCVSTATVVSWMHLNVMLYVHYLSCCI